MHFPLASDPLAPRDAAAEAWTGTPAELKLSPQTPHAGGRNTADTPPDADRRPADAGTPTSKALADTEPLPWLNAETGTCEVLPGYCILHCLGRNSVGESWVVQPPHGGKQLARFLYGFGVPPLPAVRDPLVRLVTLDHPALPRCEVAHSEPGRAVLVGELAVCRLRDRLAECQGQRLPGIPRQELLSFFQAAAEALDALYQQHSIQHLGLNPGNLLLLDGTLRLGDFGLVQLLWLPAGQPIAQFNLRYAAPELFDRQVTPSCDQYSLALSWAELLTGVHPFRGQPRLTALGERFRCKPSLELLSAADHEVVARALSRDPRRRFANCTELVQALACRTLKPGATPKKAEEPLPPGGLPVIITWPAPSPLVLAAEPSGPSLEEVLPELLAGAAGPLRVQEYQAIRYLLQPGQLLEHRCAANMPPGVARAKLDGFVEQWSAELVREDGQAFVYRVGLPVSWWQRWLGPRPVLEVEVKLLPQWRTQHLTEVGVAMRPLGCRRDVGTKLLAEVGPLLLESLRSYLQAYPEQRGQHRLLCPQPLSVSAIQPGLHLAHAIECLGKDISPAGIGFFLPQAPSSPQLYVNLGSNPFAASLGVLAKVVRVRPRGDGWFEVGARFGA